jgi:hypothetical protein
LSCKIEIVGARTVVKRGVKLCEGGQALRIKSLISDLVRLEARPTPAQQRTRRKELRDEALLAVRQDVNAKAFFKMIGTHVVSAWHDNDAVAVPSYEAIGELGEEIQRFLILLTESLLRVRRIRPDSLDTQQ